ncbi:hypothetical protein [Methylorubrum sp. SB2]|uniref:hypothetical protein n=1 Tax=Methylorubrum subtropicum TaxID=3138812 RepID=UPI00313EE4E6
MSVPQKYPDHLFIRIDRELRTGLVEAARAANLSVSEMGRRLMRDALAKPEVGLSAQGKRSAA